MIESALPEDAPSLQDHIHLKAVDALVSAAANIDKMHPIMEIDFHLSFDPDIWVPIGKDLSIPKFKLQNFLIMDVYGKLDQICEISHPLQAFDDGHRKTLSGQFIAIGLTAPSSTHR